MADAINTELFKEILLCARYGDLEDLESYFSQMDSDPVRDILTRQDDRGNTPLHFCSANGHSDVAKLLLSHTVQGIDLRNEGGNSALHWACLNGHLETVKILVDSGANVKLKNKRARIPVDEAESQGKESVVLWLLALDMKRETDAGLAQEDIEGANADGDVNVNLRAGDVVGDEAVTDSITTERSKGESLEERIDTMNMLD